MRCWVQLINFSFRWLRWWDGPLASLVSSCWRGKLQTAAGKALCWDAQALPTLRYTKIVKVWVVSQIIICVGCTYERKPL